MCWKGDGIAGGGEKHDEPQGAMGATLSRERERRRWSAPPKLSSIKDKWDGQTTSAADFGMIGLLARGGSVPIPSSGDRALFKSTDPMLAQGAMWAPVLGASPGSGAAGLSGTGIGGGGTGEGVGLGKVGDLGHTDGKAGWGTGGDGSPPRSLSGGDGAWLAHGHWAGPLRSHTPAPPRYGWESGCKVSGRLSPEAIQRIVRANFGRFRLCYERGLAGNPSLEGRVSTKFVIGARGQVLAFANDGSDLPDSAVVSCVNQAFSNLTFPEPPDGAEVTVIYPIAFDPVLGQSEHLDFEAP